MLSSSDLETTYNCYDLYSPIMDTWIPLHIPHAVLQGTVNITQTITIHHMELLQSAARTCIRANDATCIN